MPPMSAAKQNYSDSEMRSMVATLSKGKGGDTILARINPKEADMLTRAGGIGKKDNYGITQYYPADDESKNKDSGDPTAKVESVEGSGGAAPLSNPQTGGKVANDSINAGASMENSMYESAHGEVSSSIAQMLTGNPVTSAMIGHLADAMANPQAASQQSMASITGAEAANSGIASSTAAAGSKAASSTTDGGGGGGGAGGIMSMVGGFF